MSGNLFLNKTHNKYEAVRGNQKIETSCICFVKENTNVSRYDNQSYFMIGLPFSFLPNDSGNDALSNIIIAYAITILI